MKYQKVIYLACPYSTKIPFLKWCRFRQVNKKAAEEKMKTPTLFDLDRAENE